MVGRAADFPTVLATDPPPPGVTFDFSEFGQSMTVPIGVPEGGKVQITEHGDTATMTVSADEATGPHTGPKEPDSA
jgi:hypothetical protein